MIVTLQIYSHIKCTHLSGELLIPYFSDFSFLRILVFWYTTIYSCLSTLGSGALVFCNNGQELGLATKVCERFYIFICLLRWKCSLVFEMFVTGLALSIRKEQWLLWEHQLWDWVSRLIYCVPALAAATCVISRQIQWWNI